VNLSENHPSVVLAEGGAVCKSQLNAAGYTEKELDRLRHSYEILEWPDRFGGRHYPRWQFDPKLNVLPGVRDVLRIFRSRDVLYVMSQFIVRRNGRPSLLQLIRRRRAKRAAELARAQVRADDAEPEFSPRLRKELARRVSAMTDPTRHVIASSLMGRRVMVYDLENNCYGWGHVSKTSLVKDRGIAQAVAGHLSVGQKRTDVQVLRVKLGAKTVRALEKRAPHSDAVRSCRSLLRDWRYRFSSQSPSRAAESVWLIQCYSRLRTRIDCCRLSGQPRAAPMQSLL
jgi:hypothetical protein